MSSDALTAFRKELEGRSSDLTPRLKGYRRFLCDLDGQALSDMHAAIADAEMRLKLIEDVLIAIKALDEDGYPVWNDRIVFGTVLMRLREHQSTMAAALQTFHSIDVKVKVGTERDTP